MNELAEGPKRETIKTFEFKNQALGFLRFFTQLSASSHSHSFSELVAVLWKFKDFCHLLSNNVPIHCFIELFDVL